MHNCHQCGKIFKNSRSLATHKYRYHPYLRRNGSIKSEDIDTKSTISDVSSPNSNLNYEKPSESRIESNTLDIEMLNYELSSLRKRVHDLDIKLLLQCNDVEHIKKKSNHELVKTPTIPQVKDNSTELVIKKQNISTSQRLSALESKLDDLIENIQDNHSVATEDLIHDMTEIKDLFVGQKYDEILSDIPKLQQSVKLVLNGLDMNDMTDEDIQLLHKLSDCSKVSVRGLLKDNFSHLISIFTKLKPKFDDVYVDNVSYEINSDQSEHGSGGNTDSGDVTDSESDTESESIIQSDEYNSDQSETLSTSGSVHSKEINQSEENTYEHSETEAERQSTDTNSETDVEVEERNI